MARRSHHLTEVASIAGAGEVGEVGAGEREGWLNDPSLLASLHRRTSLALAHSSRSLLLLLPLSSPSATVIRPRLSPSDGRISAVEWLPFSGEEGGAAAAIVVGTSAGFLLVYSSDGDLIHKQVIASPCPLSLRFGRRFCCFFFFFQSSP